MSPRATIQHLKANVELIVLCITLACLLMTGVLKASAVFDTPARVLVLEQKLALHDSLTAKQNAMLESLVINLCLDPGIPAADFARMRLDCQRLGVAR